jgi:hypothetical protein
MGKRWDKVKNTWMRWFAPDHHGGRSFTDRVTIQRLTVGILGVLVAVAGLLLLGQTDWKEVLAGALLAWSVALIVWAFASRRNRVEEVRRDLLRTTELDVIHARLNQIASRVGARPLGLQGEIQHVTDWRMRRLAHFAGLDELGNLGHGHHADEQAIAFWDLEALGGEM